jgi:hypothetical protein
VRSCLDAIHAEADRMSIRSYVVRYDSGFAPNPFYGFCTLAACRADIRRHAKLDDWIVGCGSDERTVRRGGHIVYALRVTEVLTFAKFNADARFDRKKPYRTGSRKQSCRDNIYFRVYQQTPWVQRDSFHSWSDGSQNDGHVQKDTRTNRVLVSDDFVYFGGEGPTIPGDLRSKDGVHICKSGIGQSRFDEPDLISSFIEWIRSIGATGFQGAPFEWLTLRDK